MRSLAFLLASAVACLAAGPDLMPLPAQYEARAGRLVIDGAFRVKVSGYTEPRLTRAAARTVDRLFKQTGIPTPQAAAAGPATLLIECKGPSKPIQTLGEDESYTLEVDPTQARLSAANPLGVLRGLETFLQLVDQDGNGLGVPAVSIHDQPRFPWRGVSFDVSRHWIPLDIVKRTLDAMGAVKMNVYHWHLSDDQGFRVESKRYPKLTSLGSDGHFYTQAQVREVIAYAHELGIRVVPEFDVPGHTTAWLAAYPELGTVPGPYEIERKWGIFDPVLDPSKEIVYQFLDNLFGEMTRLFDDAYFHIGGDEVEGKQWQASARVQAFMKKEGLKDNHELQRYFSRRVQAIVQKHGKRTEGWDEILDPHLPKDIVIQSWRGQKSLGVAVQQGYSGLLSAGYYLDLMQTAEFHYLTDPINEDTRTLTAEQQSRILGGEATMWVEMVSTQNVEARVWPRAAVVAERLWSPQSVRDVRSMYARLETMSRRLELLGLPHRQTYRLMVERLAGGEPVGPVKALADIVEPVKIYARSDSGKYTQFTPLNRLVDTALPESDAARNFRYAVADKDWKTVRSTLEHWRAAAAAVRPTLEKNGLLLEARPIADHWARTAEIGLEAVEFAASGRTAPSGWAGPRLAALDEAAKPVAETLLMAAPGVRALVELAAGGSK
ncbi:MAG: family 20 glycosylhydrolase [Acidobacteria bacterium]|nr:family 20 glycosylhydrolase [Acidobacteriota bacterium]